MKAGGFETAGGGAVRHYCQPWLEYYTGRKPFLRDIGKYEEEVGPVTGCRMSSRPLHVECLMKRLTATKPWWGRADGGTWYARLRIVELLGGYQESARMAVPTLLEIVKGERLFRVWEDDDLRAEAIIALGMIRDRRAIATLHGIALNPDEPPWIRAHAIEALEQIDATEAVVVAFEALCEPAHGPTPPIYLAVPHQIGRIGPVALPFIEPYYRKEACALDRVIILEAADNVGECHGYGALVYILPFLEQLAANPQSPRQISTKATAIIDRIRVSVRE